MYYPLLKPFLFRLDPERAHYLTLKTLQNLYNLGVLQLYPKAKTNPVTLMGLTFPNPVGLAAGLDKNGEYIDALAALGFGFIEVGTVTPKPQLGNSTPRIFRLPKHQAIINRLGFNNKGVDYLIEQVRNSSYQGILGINIGKNSMTPNEEAITDYLYCFRRVYPYASYITINISSPNTQALRDLQHHDMLKNLLHTLKQEQALQFNLQNKYVPLVVKIAPDLTEHEVADIAQILLEERMDGVIATNTTVTRDGIENSGFEKEAGGLSGKPLKDKATIVVKRLAELLEKQIPIIGVGGIVSAKDANEKFAAGAELVQIYSGLVYEGPGLIQEICSS